MIDKCYYFQDNGLLCMRTTINGACPIHGDPSKRKPRKLTLKQKIRRFFWRPKGVVFY